MRSETVAASRTVRLAFFVLGLIVSAGTFFVYYRGSIAARKESIQETATTSLALAADDLGARLENWKTVVGNAGNAQNEKFEDYIELLVPGLSPASDCGDKPDIAPGKPAGLYLKSSGGFAFRFATSPRQCAVTGPETIEEVFSGLADKFEDVLIATDDGAVFYQLARTGPKITHLDLLVEASKEGSPDSSPSGSFLSRLLPGGESPNTVTPGAADGLTNILKAIWSSRRSHDFTSFSSLLPVKLDGEPFVMVVQPVPRVTASVEKQPDETAAAKLKEAAEPKEAAKPKEAEKRLILAGLIRTRTIDKQSKAWPRSTAAWVILGLVIAYSLVYSLSGIPMKPRLQPVRAIDVVRVAFSALICCSAIALAITHGYFLMVSGRDDSLIRLANAMQNHLRQELCGFYQVLDGMYYSQDLSTAVRTHSAVKAHSPDKSDSRCRVINNLLLGDSCKLDPANIRAAAIAYADPFFDYVIWSTWDGGAGEKRSAEDGQIAKWSIRRLQTPPTVMTQFEWFKEARDKRLYRLHAVEPEERRQLQDSDSKHVLVEPLRSPNTGEYQTVVVRHFDWRKGWTPCAGEDCDKGIVGTLVAPLTSLNSPVFPPGYGFAVINQDGLVLFSSDQKRNQRENLFRETDANETLIRAVRTASAQTMKLTMGEQEVLAHVLPLDQTLEGAHWYIVVYRDLARDGEMQIDTFLQTMRFMVPHGLVIFALTCGLWYLLSRRNSSHLYPSGQKGPEYATLLVLLILITVFTWLLTLVSGRSEAYGVSLLMPLVAIALASALLRQKFRILFALACVYPLIALASAGYSASGSSPEDGQRKLCDLVLVFIGLLICVLALFARLFIAYVRERLENLLPLKKRRPRLDTILYTCAACNGIFLLSVLPTIGYYRVVSQMVSASASMEDLVAITDSLESRARSARNYYDEIFLPHQDSDSAVAETERQRFVADRLALRLDRYDTVLPAAAYATVESTHKNDVPWIDRFAAWMPSALQRTPALIAGASSKPPGPDSPDRVFHLERWPREQLDSRSEFLYEKAAVDFPSTLSLWGYHRQAVLVSDFNSARRFLWISTLVLFGLVWAGVYFTVRALFFTDFRVPPVWPDIRIEDLPAVERSIILLRMVGAPAEKAAEFRLEDGVHAMDYADLREIGTPEDLTDWPRSNRPILLDNFDFSFDSPEVAAAHLTVLEKLLFSERRRLVLVAAADPAEFIAETLDPDRAAATASAEWFRDSEERWNRVFLFFGRRPLTLETPGVHKDSEAALHFARCIYASCTDAQKAVLYQICEYGWVNPNNKRALSALVSRGWVTLGPVPALADALTFMSPHLPVLTGADRLARWNMPDPAASGWITALLAVFVVFALILAGPDLAQNLPGKVTGILAAILPLWRVITGLQNRAANSAPKETVDA